ncbi:hypothetical protein M9Y10_024305 [Tritrichomonas musculus]|uniref:DUF3447 domain-containing protein n=1 Tax=Tritrichomonas musculus TaxID=1915356 RepID=A0ABR2HCP2_9EUKA
MDDEYHDWLLSFINESSTFDNVSMKISKAEPNTLNLFNRKYRLNIFEYMPKLFKIINNEKEYFFNIDILRYMSLFIDKFIEDNPHQFLYQLNIEDQRNIFKKLELLHQGKLVLFDTNDHSTCSEIFEKLKITKFPINQIMNIDDYSFINIDCIKSEPKSIKLEFKEDDLYSFLTSSKHFSFTISTNKKEYKCNKFGILLSSVIREFVSKNPELNNFQLDFTDENDEFQIICDLFNFKTIKISKENADVLLQIANDLQIDCIIEDIEKYIDSNSLFFETLDQQQKIVDQIEELYEWLFKIKELTVTKVKELITNSIWIKTTESIQELVAFIIQVMNVDYSLHPYLADLLDELNNNKSTILIPFMVEKLMNSFASNKNNCSFVYNLYKKGLIKKQELMKKIASTINKSDNYEEKECLVLWFLPEVYELNPTFFENYISDSNNELINYFVPNRIDIYNKMRDNGEPVDEISKALRKDDIELFQSLVSSTLSSNTILKIPFNLYEDFVSSTGGQCRFLDYAAAYGSVKCFKYLFLNHQEINTSTFWLAVYGGNIEIIKIVDQNVNNDFNKRNIDLNILNSLIISIAKHQNELFDWIFEQKCLSKCDEKVINLLVFMSVFYCNAHALIELVEQKFDFSYEPELCYYLLQFTSRKGFYQMSKLLFYLMQAKLKFTKINNFSQPSQVSFIIQSQSKNTSLDIYEIRSLSNIIYSSSLLFHFERIDFYNSNSIDTFHFEFSVFYGNLSILQLFEDLMNQNDFENVIIYAIKKNYLGIINYFFDTFIINNDFQITNQFAYDVLYNSVKRKNSSLFNLIVDKFKQINLDIFEEIDWNYEILLTACRYQNVEASKTLIDYIIENFYLDSNDYMWFTLTFMKAAVVGSKEICNYIISKEIDFVYDEITKYLYKLVSIDLEIIIKLMNTLSPTDKEDLLNKLISPAIASKNKNLIRYLLQQTPPIGETLLWATQTNDFDVFNLVLEYNNDPFYINKVFENSGSVLQYSIYNNDVEFIQEILTVPGIDVNILLKNGNSLLVDMILQENIVLNCKYCCNNGISLTQAIKLNEHELIYLIIDHPSFDKTKSQLPIALSLCIQTYNRKYFKKLLMLVENHDEIFQSLSHIFSSFDQNSLSYFQEICHYNMIKGKFIDFNKFMPNGNSFLTAINPCFQSIIMIVFLLLENGADPNIPDKNGKYPLQHAIELNCIDLVCALIESNKIDYNIKIRIKRKISTDQNMPGETVIKKRKTYAKYKSFLHLAARSENVEILDVFLNRNLIDINIVDDLGETPFMEACRYLRPMNIDRLSKIENLDYLHCNKKGEDALLIVSKNNNLNNCDEIRKSKDEYFKQCILLVKFDHLMEL